MESAMYGKSTETAIAVMSRLAEMYDGSAMRLSAAAIADSRSLHRPFVAKILTTLSNGKLVNSVRGVHGGFALSRHPRDIVLYDVFVLFERENKGHTCPFGGGVCGLGKNCPVHQGLVRVQQAADRVLHDTSFEQFRAAYQDHGSRPSKARGNGMRRKSRASFRARGADT